MIVDVEGMQGVSLRRTERQKANRISAQTPANRHRTIIASSVVVVVYSAVGKPRDGEAVGFVEIIEKISYDCRSSS